MTPTGASNPQSHVNAQGPKTQGLHIDHRAVTTVIKCCNSDTDRSRALRVDLHHRSTKPPPPGLNHGPQSPPSTRRSDSHPRWVHRARRASGCHASRSHLRPRTSPTFRRRPTTPNRWAWLSDEAITTGTTLTTFSPENTLTRGEFATFLWRYAGLPGVTITGEFTDVPTGAFYEIAVYWMLEQGITTGKTATMFAPDDPVTRSELATFLWRYAGLPGATITGEFSDVPIGAFYEIAVYWMLDEGITTGTSTTTYSPNDPVTRAQLSAFLWRYDDEPLAECLDESVGTNATLAANTEALVAANEGAYPWLRDAWNYAQVYMSVASKQLSDDFAGIVVSDCHVDSDHPS